MRQRRPKGLVKIECSKCGEMLEPDRIGKHRYCLKCHAEQMRNSRRKYSELFPEARKRANARTRLKHYVKAGKVKKGPCEVCGSTEKIEAHHEDYDKPLVVHWLCRKHHLKKTEDEKKQREEK